MRPAVTSRPVASETFFPRVEYGQFLVFDEAQWPDSMPDPRHGIQALPGGFVVFTTATDFYPAVTVTTDAVRTPEGWEAAGSAAFRVLGGLLLVRSVMQDPAGAWSVTPGAYVVNAFTRGGQQARARTQEELFFRGIEEWLLVLQAQ